MPAKKVLESVKTLMVPTWRYCSSVGFSVMHGEGYGRSSQHLTLGNYK